MKLASKEKPTHALVAFTASDFSLRCISVLVANPNLISTHKLCYVREEQTAWRNMLLYVRDFKSRQFRTCE